MIFTRKEFYTNIADEKTGIAAEHERTTMDILYTDKYLSVCIKPRGVDSEAGGMPELLKQQLGKDTYCVHRLDKAVSGVMVYAHSAQAAAKLTAQLGSGELEKTYIAVIPGVPEYECGAMDDLLFKDASKNRSYVVKRMRRGVRTAHLDYITVQAADELSLQKIKLGTGRSHQIRVQYSSRRLPLLGDVKYGSAEKRCHIALFSHVLAFRHPATGEKMSFSALPEKAFPWDRFDLSLL